MKILHSRDVRFNEEKKIDYEDDKEADENRRVVPDETRRVILDLPCEPDQESLDVTDDKAAKPTVRKSTRERNQTKFYGVERSHLSFQNEPVSYEEATISSDNSKWIKAMESEMKSLNDSDVWDIVPLPSGKKAVGSKWVYKIKTGADGTIERYIQSQIGCSRIHPTIRSRLRRDFQSCCEDGVISCPDCFICSVWFQVASC